MSSDMPLDAVAQQLLLADRVAERTPAHLLPDTDAPLTVGSGPGTCAPQPVASPCPLTPALLELLQAAVLHGDTSDSLLAAALHRSPHTVKTEWKRVLAVLGVQSRSAALLVALRQGWVSLQLVEAAGGM